MADTLLSFGVEKLWDLLARESERLQGVEDQLDELKRNLNNLRSFLKDADAKKHSREAVRNCVDEIKEIVLDTEDIIETFLLKEEFKKRPGIKRRIRRLSCILMDRRKIASEMEDISKRISNVTHDMQAFGVQQMIINAREDLHPLQERQREMRKTFPSYYGEDLVGLEEKVEKLVGYLVVEESIRLVSITGMGGIGKTTLAQQIFNHETVKNHFERLAWVCISQQFTRKDVWYTILWNLSPEYKGTNMTEDELLNELSQVLETQKTLIVLDDIWEKEDWDRIKPIFLHGKGWKVLLTSRNEDVGLWANPKCFTFRTDFLTSNESWTLFRRIVFQREDTTEYKEEMEKMGKLMIEHCGGLPLAVKVLGGLLAAKYSLHEWKKVFENIRPHITGGTSFNVRNINSVYHILYLGFEELPIYLKHCFLYLAHFPEDYEIDVEELAYYWAAEGIPRPRFYDSLTSREVGYEYIEELVKRNMVISKRDLQTLRFETCRLHDMMREFCLIKAKEENFVQVIDGKSTTGNSNSRRVALHLHEGINDSIREITYPKIRSLLTTPRQKRDSDHIGSSLWLTRLQLMRVLDLCYLRFEGKKLPSSIGELIHLRYLSLYKAGVTQLPSSLRNLKLLLYLNLHLNTYDKVYVPNIFNEMRELIYLSLPKYVDDKTKLELGNLVNLETLLNFSTDHGRVTDLHQMARLRTLGITFHDDVSVESLSELRLLEDLTIFICEMEEDPMPSIEKLPHLKVLRFHCLTSLGKRMVCSAGGFPQLQYLEFRDLSGWENWIVEEGSMPCLRTLAIDTCRDLKLCDGLRFVPSITNLKVHNMKEEWMERLSEGGEDYHKVQHIPSVTFQFLWFGATFLVKEPV